MKSLLHRSIYNPKWGTYLKWWYFKTVWQHDLLPFYLNIPFSRYKIAVWNCGTTFPGKTRWQHWLDVRITIRERKTGIWMFTLKQGNYADLKSCSKDFKPFGISLQRYFKTAAK